VQNWNVTLERQIGSDWGVAVSYLGSYTDRLWAQTAINPGIFMGLGPCTIQGVRYNVCSTNANLNQRRVLFQENPAEGRLIGALDLNDDIGWQEYRGLKLSVQRRSVSGLSLNGNYTWSRCIGTDTPNTFSQISSGYTNPDDPEYDRGYCDQDRRHLATITLGAETPEFSGAAMRALASGWRASGIVSTRSGRRINIISGLDRAFTGVRNQRPAQVNDDVYARTLTNYFNRAALAQPEPGTYGSLKRNALTGPKYWSVDLAVSRVVGVPGMQNLELRLEAFNLFNTFNWGDPASNENAGGTVANFNSGTFGRITTQAGDPRIIQLGIKYAF
jgi:hypothetical protein